MKASDPVKIFEQVSAYPEDADAVVPDQVAVLFFPGTSLRTFQRHCPAPVIPISARKQGRSLKALRALARGEKPAA